MENKCTLIDKEKTTSSILKNIGYAAVTTGLISTLAPGIGILSYQYFISNYWNYRLPIWKEKYKIFVRE